MMRRIGIRVLSVAVLACLAASGREAAAIELLRFGKPKQAPTTWHAGRSAFQAAHKAVIRELGGQHVSGTTAIALRLVAGEPGAEPPIVALLAYLGDSRALLVRGNKVKPLTTDHSFGGRLLHGLGHSNPGFFRDPDTQALHRYTTPTSVRPGDYFLLHTNGLSHVEREVIAEILRGKGGIEDKARELVALGASNPKRDDASLALAWVKDGGLWKKNVSFETAAATRMGNRHRAEEGNNEDSVRIVEDSGIRPGGPLLIVADGMGGQKGSRGDEPERASRTAVETIARVLMGQAAEDRGLDQTVIQGE